MSKMRAWTLGGFVIAALMAAAGWFLGVAPQLQQADAARTELEDVSAQNQVQTTRLASLRAQFDDMGALNDELADLQGEVTPVNDLSDFVDNVTRLAQEKGAVLDKYLAEPPVSTVAAIDPAAVAAPAADAATEGAAGDGATDAPAGDAASAPADEQSITDENLFAVPITLTFTSSDSQLLEVAKALQTSRQVFLVTKIGFGGDDGRVISGYIFVTRAPATEDAAAETEPVTE